MRNGRLINRRNRRAFTLLELILVIIVAIIMGIYIFHRARLARQRAVAGVLADTGAIVKWNDDEETVRSLVMTGMPVEQLKLKDIEQLVDLVAVNLDHSETEDRHLARLADNHTLKELYLVGTAISDEGCRTLGKLTDLETLDLRATFIGDEGLKEIAKLKKLKGLRVAQTWISDAGMKSIGSLHRLKWLDIRHTDITDEGLVHLAGLTSLKRLRATGSRVSRAGLDELKRTIPDLKIQWFPEKNRDLRVRLKPRNYLDPPSGDDAIHLSERTLIKEVRQLTKEYQGGNRNPNAILFAANINQNNGFVRTLDLSGSKVIADQIHRARWCRNLSHFRLWQTQVGDDAFAYIHRNRFLERVFIYDKTVSDESMKQLAKLPNLHYLEMYGVGLTDEGMRALAQCESLSTVNIRDVDITDKGLEGWNSVAMPNIRSILIDDRGGLSKKAVTQLVHDFPSGRVYLPKHTAWMREAQGNRPR